MKNRLLHVAAAILALAVAVPAAALERADLPVGYKWDLSSLFADEAQWVASKQALSRDIPGLQRWQGRLGESGGTLLTALQGVDSVRQRVERLYAYAMQLSDQDTRVGRHQQMQQEAEQVYTSFETATAFVRPELLAVGRHAIERINARQKG